MGNENKYSHTNTRKASEERKWKAEWKLCVCASPHAL